MLPDDAFLLGKHFMQTASNIIKYVRYSYFISLVLMLSISLVYFSSARQMNVEIKRFSELALHLSKLDRTMQELAANAKRIFSSNDLTSVTSLKTSMKFYASNARKHFDMTMSGWDKANPKLKSSIIRSSQQMGGEDPFQQHKRLLDITDIDKAEKLEDIRWVGQKKYGIYNSYVAASNQLIEGKLYEVLDKKATEVSSLISWFIITGIASVIAIGLIIFFPLERSIANIITDLNRLRVRAENADRAKSEFLANMSHEIRTPMNGVMGMAELLGNTGLDKKQKMFVDVIIKSGGSLVAIINDILDFTKIDAGQLKLDPKPFILAETVDEVAAVIAPGIDNEKVELIVRIQPGLPEFFIGDAGRIRQAITNIVGNAIKFTHSGHVLVDVSGDLEPEKDGKVMTNLIISVTDTGIGIPEEKLDSIFDKFSQVDGSATRKHEGTGLGLSITKMLVEMMDGAITIESQVHQGSTFRISLPLEVDGKIRQPSIIPKDVTGSRILIIDDNEINRRILMEQMASWQFDATQTSSGLEALTALHRGKSLGQPYDLMIIDYQMPGMDGIEVVNQARHQPGIQHTPVIMLTSVDNAGEDAIRGLDIQGHLVKPARALHLLEVILKVLSKPAEGADAIERNITSQSGDENIMDTEHKGTGT